MAPRKKSRALPVAAASGTKQDATVAKPKASASFRVPHIPKELKAELDRRIRDSDFHSYKDLANWLRRNGYQMREESIRRYKHRFDRKLEAVRLATEQAKAICEQFDGDDVSMQEALMRLVQTEMFNLLTSLNEKKLRPSSPDNHARKSAPDSMALARTVATIAKASIAHQDWAQRMKKRVAERVEAATEKVDAAKQDGLSEAAAEKIRNALMDIRL
ncbi:MAG TPA: phage protein Gp27 family protein [Candidatus Binataceae bacterium]|nr:phage protein Gp27 family protein [Candidatus Binataceae bacterium]